MTHHLSLIHGADFEGSLYDEEESGFHGAGGLESQAGKKGRGGAARREIVVQQLEAEHESAKQKIELLKAEFGL